MNGLEDLLLVLGGFLIVIGIFVLVWFVFYIIGLWKMFEKAGQPGWKAIIPFYNTWTLVEITGLNWYWFLVALVPTIISLLGLESLSFVGNVASIIANVNIYYNLSKKFGKETSWVVLSVFFGFITIPMLGYSKNEVWNSAAAVTPNGAFDAKKGAVNQQQGTPQPMNMNPQPMNQQPMNMNPQPMQQNVQQPVNPQPMQQPVQPMPQDMPAMQQQPPVQPQGTDVNSNNMNQQ